MSSPFLPPGTFSSRPPIQVAEEAVANLVLEEEEEEATVPILGQEGAVHRGKEESQGTRAGSDKRAEMGVDSTLHQEDQEDQVHLGTSCQGRKEVLVKIPGTHTVDLGQAPMEMNKLPVALKGEVQKVMERSTKKVLLPRGAEGNQCSRGRPAYRVRIALLAWVP